MLGQANTNTDVEVYPNPADTVDYGYPIVVAGGNYAYYFPTLNYGRWTDWWGGEDPEFPDDWNTGGSVILSLDKFHGSEWIVVFRGSPWINSGDTVEGGYEFAMGGNHPAATVSLVSGANITADVVCQGGSSYTLTIPLPAQSYSIPAGNDGWLPSNNPSSPLVFQGSTTATPPTGVSWSALRVGRLAPTSAPHGLSEGGDGNPGGPELPDHRRHRSSQSEVPRSRQQQRPRHLLRPGGNHQLEPAYFGG